MRAKPGIESIIPYQPGKPIEEVQRELGLREVVKLASNENPLGPSPLAAEAIRYAAGRVNLYPDGNAYYLKQDLSMRIGFPPEQIILGNGSNDVLQIIGDTFISPGDEVVYSEQAFVVYMLVSRICGAKEITTPLVNHTHNLPAMAERVTPFTKVVFIANPNNPTGTIVTQKEVEAFMERVPENVLVVFDEAYYEYVENPEYPDTLRYVREGRNVIVLRTFSKIYALAGLRIGYGISTPQIIDLLNRVRQPFNVNLIAQEAARASLQDSEHVRESRRVNSMGKRFLYEELDKIGLEYVPSEANFILVHLRRPADAVFQEMMKLGVIVRPMKGYDFPNSIRVTVGTMDQNRRFIAALREALKRVEPVE
jgi:histidinol-phosphate aminotransferase